MGVTPVVWRVLQLVAAREPNMAGWWGGKKVFCSEKKKAVEMGFCAVEVLAGLKV